MRVWDLNELPWQLHEGYQLKDVTETARIIMVTRTAAMPVGDVPCTLLALSGQGRLAVGSTSVLVSTGVVVSLSAEDPVWADPAVGSPLLLLLQADLPVSSAPGPSEEPVEPPADLDASQGDEPVIAPADVPWMPLSAPTAEPALEPLTPQSAPADPPSSETTEIPQSPAAAVPRWTSTRRRGPYVVEHPPAEPAPVEEVVAQPEPAPAPAPKWSSSLARLRSATKAPSAAPVETPTTDPSPAILGAYPDTTRRVVRRGTSDTSL